MIKIAVSACLLGKKVRYDGKSKPNNELMGFFDEISESVEVVPICPEVSGGLPTPRPPSEIVGGARSEISGAPAEVGDPVPYGVRVVNSEGRDVTVAYEKGASVCLGIIKENDIKIAVLKARSPACGKNSIYDGTFSKKLVPGHGMLAGKLMDEGIDVFTEEELTEFKEAVNRSI